MKKIYRISLMLFALALCGLAACSRDSVDEVVAVGDGNTANVKLKFTVNSSPEVETRAAQSTYYEYLVQNIYVFVFNGDKRVPLSQNYFEPGNIDNYINKEDSNNNQQSSGTINFGAVSGSGLRICAIANIGTSNSVMGDMVTRATTNETGSTGDGSGDVTTDADCAKLDAITSYTDLKKLSVELKSNTIFRGASFLMTGEVTDNLVANQTTEVTIPLSRTDSKITFNVTASATDSSVADMKFIPGKWRVVNVPAVSYVLPHIEVANAGETLTEDKDATIDESDFFSVSEAEAPQFEGTVGGVANSGTFTFYMYENLKKPADGITEESTSDYALREKQTKTDIGETSVSGVSGQKYVNGDYVYAPKFGTYVVFTGELSYTLNKGTTSEQYVIADVEYCVHLGHDSHTNFDCYNTLRNYHYTYNVTITGVKTLVVEVDSDNNSDPDDDQEPRPGAEGDVVISATEIHNVDGHYDRALIKLTKEEASKLLFSVSTPFERGIDDMTGDAELKDYKWIKFLVNSEVSVGDTSYAAYPGDACYDGGASAQGAGAESSVYGKSVVLRDIRQLSNYFAANNPTGDVYITAFVDEYLYFYDPTKDNVVTNDATTTTYKSAYTATDAADLLMWKKSVNTSDRMLHIVKAGDMKYSADGETSVSRSVVTFKQRPVLTFYNVAADGLTTAWGTETINETPKMTVTRTYTSSNQSQENYYIASQELTAGPKWASVISSTPDDATTTDKNEKYELQSGYSDPSYACALRNRDFNGNGTIDQNEVQWYLAALSQIADLWIGQPSMPSYSYLFDPSAPDGYYTQGTAYDWPATHYATSTINYNSGYSPNYSPMIYWAEEYGATSNHAQAINWKQAPLKDGAETDGNWEKDKDDAIVAVRCVRNLGKKFTDTTLPQNYVVIENVDNLTISSTKTSNTNNVYQLNLDYINPTALRSWDDEGGALPVDVLNTITENNRPYSSFIVDPDYYPTSGTTRRWFDFYSAERYGTDRVCPDGYRVPNQREMVIMSRLLDGWDSNGSSGDGWSGSLGTYTKWYVILNHQILYDKTNSVTRFGSFYYYPKEDRVARDMLDKTFIEKRVDETTGADTPDTTDDDYETYLRDYSSNYRPVVRCVKDNQGYTPQSLASTYNNGGSVTQ